VAAGTFSMAEWTKSATGTATVNSGEISFTIPDDPDGDGVFDFTADLNNCEDELLPGETCEFPVTITNDGDFSFVLATSSITADAGNPTYAPGAVPCFTAAWDGDGPPVAGFVEGGDATNDYDPTQSDTAILVVTLDANAGNECQAETASFDVTFTATLSATPRD